MEHLNLHILHFPPNVLNKILSYVPNRRSVALACKTFYEHVCEIEKDYYRLIVHFGMPPSKALNIESDDIYQSIMNTKRQIMDIEFDPIFAKPYFARLSPSEQQIECIRIVLKKFGPTLKTLKLFQVAFSDVLSFLQLTPNLEDLSLWPTGNIDNVDIVNGPLLPKLTKLYMLDGFDDKFLSVLVPDNSLHTFLTPTKIQPSSIEPISNLIKKQKNLKEISWHLLGIVSIDSIQLERFNTLMGQYNLLKIKVLGTHVSDDNFSLVCRMKKLKVLDVNINGVSAEAFCFLSRLVSLEKLRIECYRNYYIENIEKFNVDYFEKLIAIQNPQLKMLDLDARDNIYGGPTQLIDIAEILKRISINNPNIESLRVYLEDLNLIQQIVHDFQNLITLKINYNSFIGHVSFPFDTSSAYARLLHLSLSVSGPEENVRNLMTLTDQCVNLRKIQIVFDYYYKESNRHTFEYFKHLLKYNTKLTHIIIFFDGKMHIVAEELVSLIKQFGRNLEFFCARVAACDNRDILKQCLNDEFPYVELEYLCPSILINIKKHGASQPELQLF